MFPFHYDPKPFSGRDDVNVCFKAVFAQYLYIHEIQKYYAQGVDFIHNPYFPEFCKDSQEYLHEREDRGHLLKRLTQCFREGHFDFIDSKVFKEVLADPNTGLTKQALCGERKQNVHDCELVWSLGVLSFLDKHGYKKEARAVRIIRNWHQSVDGRGLSEEERGICVQQMLYWLLSDLLPGFHKDSIDFRKVDVARNLSSDRVRGLTRKVNVGMLANLTSLQMRIQEYSTRQLPPEHPRAGASDDVESFISVLHEMLGDSFDIKQLYQSLPKIMNEFLQRINSDCTF